MIPTLDFVRGNLFNRILTEYHIVQTTSSFRVPSSTVTIHDSYTGFREGEFIQPYFNRVPHCSDYQFISRTFIDCDNT